MSTKTSRQRRIPIGAVEQPTRRLGRARGFEQGSGDSSRDPFPPHPAKELLPPPADHKGPGLARLAPLPAPQLRPRRHSRWACTVSSVGAVGGHQRFQRVVFAQVGGQGDQPARAVATDRLVHTDRARSSALCSPGCSPRAWTARAIGSGGRAASRNPLWTEAGGGEELLV